MFGGIVISLLNKKLPFFSRRLTVNFIRNSSVKSKNLSAIKAQKENDIDFSKLNPDNFGDLADISNGVKKVRLKSEDLPNDPDGYDQLEIKRGIKISLDSYIRMFRQLYLKKPRDVREMLKLHRKFIYEDRYIPIDRRMYTMLIDSCAQVGFTKKALELYHEMKRYDMKPTKATITALFNACANCSYTKQYGIEKTLLLREELQLTGYELNDIHYNSMIKAFAKLGDMKNAQQSLKEMIQKGHQCSVDTYAMLLMGCISDHKSGLLQAIPIMHQVLHSNLHLDVSLFNLFLRCVRDCQLSSENEFNRLLSNNSQLLISDGKSIENQEKLPVTVSISENLPNLLNGTNIDQVVSIKFSSLASPRDRFLLFGGLDGYIQLMQSFNAAPNIKTVTLLVDLLAKNDYVEKILNLVHQFNLKIDVCLYNVLIKKAAKSNDYPLCQELIGMMQKNNTRPDIMTFGALTFVCSNPIRAKHLLRDMEDCGIIPNAQIIGSLINIACNSEDLKYLKFILDYVQTNAFSLNNIDIEQIDLLLNKIKQQIIENERKNISGQSELKNLHTEMIKMFRQQLRTTQLEVSTNPWRQFEEEPVKSGKSQYHSVARYMKKKIDFKLNRDNKDVIDYNDEIDD